MGILARTDIWTSDGQADISGELIIWEEKEGAAAIRESAARLF